MSELQNNLFQTIDTIIQERLNELSFDKTEICTIVSQDSSEPLCYWVTNNNNLKFKAYSNGGEEYKQSDIVYITIPQGNYEAKKIILGSYGSNKTPDSVSLENPFQNFIICNSFAIEGGVGFDDIPMDNTYVSKILEPINFNKTGYGELNRIGIEFSVTAYSEINSGEFQILLNFLDENGKSLFPTEKDNYLVFSSKQLYGNPYYLTEEFEFQYLFAFPTILLENDRFNLIDKIEIKFIHREGFETLFLNKCNVYFGYDKMISEEARINLVSPNVNRDIDESYKTVFDGTNKTELKILNLEWFKNNRIYNQGPQIETNYEELKDYDIYWLQYCPTIAYTKMLESNREGVKECYRATLEQYKNALTEKFEDLGEGTGKNTVLYNRYVALYDQNQTAFNLNVENTLIDIAESGTYWQTIKKAKATELINYYFEFRPSEHFSQYKASYEEGKGYVYKDSDRQFEFLDQAEEEIKVIIKNRETGEWVETNGFLFKNVDYIPNYGSVSNIDIVFALGDTNSDPPTLDVKEWTTTVPEKTDKLKYIWQRQKISYVGKQDEYSNPVCVTGEDGQAIEKVYELYYLWDGKEETDPSKLAMGNDSLKELTDKIADFGARSDKTHDIAGNPYDAPNKWLSTRCPTWVANHNYYTSTLFIYTDQSYLLTPISSLGGLDSANQNSSFDNMVTKIDTLFKLSLSNTEIKQDENWGDPKDWDWATTLPEVYPDTTDNLYIWTKQAYFKGSSTEPSYYSNAVCITGNDGSVGKTSYIHIAYANSADGKKDFSATNSINKSYIGQYTDFEKEDSDDWTKYSWTQFKGEAGSPGKDGTATEYIYFLHDRAYQWAGWDGNKNDYTQLPTPYGSSNKWTPSPSGITTEQKYEYVSVRTSSYNGDTKKWSVWSKPVVWSKWGDKGQDGDGVKYVYYLSAELKDLNQPEWPIEETLTTITSNVWTEEPQGVSSIYKYEYVSQFKTPVSTGDKGTIPTLWNQWVDSLIAKYIKAKSIPNTPNIGEEAAAGWLDVVPSNLEADERIYMIQRYTQDEVWSNPIQISGLDGEAGADAMDIEFAYYCTKEVKDWSSWDGKGLEIKENSGTEAWYDNPYGITETYKYEYMTTRTRTGTSEGGWGGFDNSDTSIQSNNWSVWSKPVVWSKWGEKGADGDGVKYVFYLSNNNIAPNAPVWSAIEDSLTTGEWRDEPQGVGLQYKYEYVSQFKTPVSDGAEGTTPTLWATYSEKLLTLYYVIEISSTNKDAPSAPTVDKEEEEGWRASYDDKSKDIIQVYITQRHESDETWSVPLPLMGVDGNAGTPGYSLISMLELYYLDTKKKSPSKPSNQVYQNDIGITDAWNKQCPTWKPGGVYYVCEEMRTGIPMVDDDGNVQQDTDGKIIYDTDTIQITYTDVRKIEGLTSANEAANAAQQAINNINKNTVKSVDIYFARSNSRDTIDETTGYKDETGKIIWVTNVKDINGGINDYPYIWMKQKMTMADKTENESSPVCIGGKDGNSIIEIIEWYYLKTNTDDVPPLPNDNAISNEIPIPSNKWATQTALWQPGGVYYTCLQLIYSDNSEAFTAPMIADTLNKISGSGLAKELSLTLINNNGIYNWYDNTGKLEASKSNSQQIQVDFIGSRKTSNLTNAWYKTDNVYEITWQIPTLASMIEPSGDNWNRFEDYYELTYTMDKNNPDETRILNYQISQTFSYNKTNNIIYCQIAEYKNNELQKVFVTSYNNFQFGFSSTAGTEWRFNIISDGDDPNFICDVSDYAYSSWGNEKITLKATLSNLNDDKILPKDWVDNVIWEWAQFTDDNPVYDLMGFDSINYNSNIDYRYQRIFNGFIQYINDAEINSQNNIIIENNKYYIIEKNSTEITLQDCNNETTKIQIIFGPSSIESQLRVGNVISFSFYGYEEWGVNVNFIVHTSLVKGQEKINIYNNYGEVDKMAIIKATLYNLETAMGQINLTAYYPIGIGKNEEYKFNGPSLIVYANDGTTPQYDDVEYRISEHPSNETNVFKFRTKVQGYDEEYGDYYEYVDDPYFIIDKNKKLVPSSGFIPSNKKLYIEARDKDDNFIYAQPVLILRNQYESAILNEWDGTLKIDEDTNSIFTAFFMAGRKDNNNTFSGVLLGEVGSATKLINSKNGLYGLQNGELRFKLDEDANFFVGNNNDSYINFVKEDNTLTVKTKNFELDTPNLKISSENNNFSIYSSKENLRVQMGKVQDNDIYGMDIYEGSLWMFPMPFNEVEDSENREDLASLYFKTEKDNKVHMYINSRIKSTIPISLSDVTIGGTQNQDKWTSSFQGGINFVTNDNYTFEYIEGYVDAYCLASLNYYFQKDTEYRKTIENSILGEFKEQSKVTAAGDYPIFSIGPVYHRGGIGGGLSIENVIKSEGFDLVLSVSPSSDLTYRYNDQPLAYSIFLNALNSTRDNGGQLALRNNRFVIKIGAQHGQINSAEIEVTDTEIAFRVGRKTYTLTEDGPSGWS